MGQEEIITFLLSVLFLSIICIYLGWKLHKIGYSGVLWAIVSFFGGIVPFFLAMSLPDRRVELLRSEEEALLEGQLRQASLPVNEGEVPIPRTTISDDLTRAGEV